VASEASRVNKEHAALKVSRESKVFKDRLDLRVFLERST